MILILTGPSWIPYTNEASTRGVSAASRDKILREEPLSREEPREAYMDQLRRSGTSDQLEFASKEVEQLSLVLKGQDVPLSRGHVHWANLPEDVEIVFGYGDNLSCKVAAEVHVSWLHDWSRREDLAATTPLNGDDEWAEAVEAADAVLVGGASQEEVVKAAFLAGKTPVWGQIGTGFRGYHPRGKATSRNPDYGVIN